MTSDQELCRRALKQNAKCLLFKPSKLVSKLSMLARTYGLDLRLNPTESRCPLCNGQLRETSNLAELKDRVPSKVQETNKEFWVCTNCEKVYWMGGHWKGITKTVNEARELLSSEN